jgi:hypothetical protein
MTDDNRIKESADRIREQCSQIVERVNKDQEALGNSAYYNGNFLEIEAGLKSLIEHWLV